MREAGLQQLTDLSQWLEMDALRTMPEIASGDYFRPLESSVPHQLFSSFAFLVGATRGMLGLDIDQSLSLIHI